MLIFLLVNIIMNNRIKHHNICNLPKCFFKIILHSTINKYKYVLLKILGRCDVRTKLWSYCANKNINFYPRAWEYYLILIIMNNFLIALSYYILRNKWRNFVFCLLSTQPPPLSPPYISF